MEWYSIIGTMSENLTSFEFLELAHQLLYPTALKTLKESVTE
jgi:hypothetical protein